MPRKRTTEETVGNLFWKKVEKTPACWNWKAFTDISGYGTFRYNGFGWKAHRLSWVFENGPIPEDKIICHKCDNPACVRPSHLFIGTNKDNTQDMLSKGRKKLGFQHVRSRLDKKQVMQVLDLLDKGFEQKQIAAMYGVHKETVGRINRGMGYFAQTKEEFMKLQ